MSYPTVDKRQLTEQLLGLMPGTSLSIDQALRSWWYSRNSTSGLRLTDIGYDAFTDDLDLESYLFNVEHIVPSPRVILQLSKLISCPYYIERTKLRWLNLHLFGSRQAVELTLYGDLQRYLSSF
jgi:hypothetical protein